MISYILLLINYSINIIIDFTYDTKLILFNMSIFFGGIQVYTSMTFIFALIFGLALNYKFRLSDPNTMTILTQLFESWKLIDKTSYNHEFNSPIVSKMNTLLRVCFKMLNTFIISFGKSINT